MTSTRQVMFPQFSGIRCLMMPYVQGDPASIPDVYAPYRDIVAETFLVKGDLGFLTIDESPVAAGQPHRGARAKFGRALHTEAGRVPDQVYCWGGGGGWGAPSPPYSAPPTKRKPKAKPKPRHRVTLERDVRILIASNLDGSCAVWDAEHEDTSKDGDIGHLAAAYPYDHATILRAGEVSEIGILTPHESLPVLSDFDRQFLRIVSSGVHGREDYFTRNPLVPFEP